MSKNKKTVPAPVLMDVTLTDKVKHAAAVTAWKAKCVSKRVHMGCTGAALLTAAGMKITTELADRAADVVVDALVDHGDVVAHDYKVLRESKPTLKFLAPVEDKAQVKTSSVEVLIPDAVILG